MSRQHSSDTPAPSSPRKPAPVRAALMVCAFALTLRLAFCFVVVPLCGIDMGPRTEDFYQSSDGYVDLAVTLMEHGRFSFDPDAPPSLFRCPGFPTVVGLMYLVVRDAGTALVLVNCLASAATAMLVYLLAYLIASARVALWSGLAAACLPLSVYYTAHGFADPFLALVVVAYALACVALIRRPSARMGALGGVVFALAVLTKPVVLPFAFLLVLFALLCHRRMLLPSLVSAAIGLVLVGGWTARNYALTGRFVPVSTGSGFNLLVGNLMIEVEGYADEVFDGGVALALDRVYHESGTRLTWSDLAPAGHYDFTPEMDGLFAASARRMIQDDPFLLVRKAWVNLGRFWWLSSTPLKSGANLIVNSAVLLLAVPGLCSIRTRKPLEVTWLGLFVTAYVGVYCLIIVSSSRFTLPVTALLLPFAVSTGLSWARALHGVLCIPRAVPTA